MVDKNKRSLAKAVTWRMVATSITMMLFYIATGKITISIMAGAAETVLKLGVYYAHERTWNKVKWGQER